MILFPCVTTCTRFLVLMCCSMMITLWPTASAAQQTAPAMIWEIRDTRPEPTDVSAYLRIHRDASGSMKIEDAVAQPAAFLHHENRIPSFGFTGDTIWSCLKVRSLASEPIDLITLLETARLSDVSWYLVEPGGSVILSKNKEKTDQERMPALHWTLPPGEERWLFLRTGSETSIWLPVFSGDEDAMQSREMRTVLVDGLLVGFCLAIAVMVVVSGWLHGSRMHYLLASVVMAYVAYFLIFHGYVTLLWSHTPRWVEQDMLALVIGAGVTAFALFHHHFLHENSTGWGDRCCRRASEWMPLCGLATLLVLPFSGSIQIINTLSLGSVMISLVNTVRHGCPRGERAWYLGGWAVLGLMMLLFVLQFSGLIPLIVSFRHAQLITAPLMLLGFLVAVVMRQQSHAHIQQQRTVEKHAHDLIGHIAAGIYEVSLSQGEDGRIAPRFHFTSPQYLAMFDITEEELERNPGAIYERVHPDDRQPLQQALMHAIAHLSSFRWEGRVMWDGKTRWIQAASGPRVNSQGVTVWFGVVTDITPLKQAQQALYRTLENLPVPISCDNMGEPPLITMINEQFVKTFGYRLEEIPTVADWAMRAYPDASYRAEVMDWWYHAVEVAKQERGKIESRELIVRCKDGSDKEIIISTTMLENSMILAFLDITERNRAARELEALRTSREKSAFELTENMPAGTYAMRLNGTPDGRILMDFRFASRRLLELFNVTRESFQRNPEVLVEAIHPDDREGLIMATARAYESSQTFHWEGRTLIDGTVRWLNISSNPRSDHEGRIVWEGVVNDITAHMETERKLEETLQNEKRLRQEAEELRRDAERAHEAKSLFLAKMSHEIRTPLSALVSLSQAMWMRGEMHAVDEEFTPFLNRVRSGGQYLNLLLRNVLNVSAAESGRVPVKPGEFYVADWVADIQNILEPIAEYYRGRFEWSLPEDDEARWFTDQMRLTQIVLNLCENALKFSSGQDQPVRVGFQITAEFLEISVVDHGPGIPLDRQASIFAAFSQGGRKISPLDEGVGLGLTVVKINTELLHGHVAIENLMPHGTRFLLRCPPYPRDEENNLSGSSI